MTSRRLIVLAIILPAFIATGVALAWSAWSQQRHQDRVASLAGQTAREKVLIEAIGSLGGEVGYVIAAKRVSPTQIPAALAPYAASGRTLTSTRGGRAAILPLLDQVDKGGPEALARLQDSGIRTSNELERVMRPMEGGAQSVVAAGTGMAGVPWDDYAAGITELQGHFAAASPASRAALEQLVAVSRQDRGWTNPEFLALAAGLLAFVLVAAALAGWRVALKIARAESARDDERRRAEALAFRNTRLMNMVDASRRVQEGNDLGSAATAVASETRDLLGASCGVVFLLDEEGTAHPVACAGDPRPAPVVGFHGIVGRSMDSGSSTRTVVAGDVAFPDASGPLSLVVAPLVVAGKVTGALVVVRTDDVLADDDDEGLVRLVAQVAATAIEAARTHETTARLVHTDSLTGLANRRRMDGDLADLHTEDHSGGVAFLMIDIDNFKNYNDTNGHPAGDTLLRTMADTLRECVRDTDVVYRFGGEEFAVLLRNANDLEAQAVATRIRSAVAAHSFPGGDSQPGGQVTVSVGLSRHEDGDDAAGLVSEADEALYSAKRAGRNRVVVAA
jgi:diguanylate cyclase (GGDEF)-like protein